jgi:hypothetical protein
VRVAACIGEFVTRRICGSPRDPGASIGLLMRTVRPERACTVLTGELGTTGFAAAAPAPAAEADEVDEAEAADAAAAALARRCSAAFSIAGLTWRSHRV